MSILRPASQAICALCFLAALAGLPLRAADKGDWNGLREIRKGEKVEVVLSSMKKEGGVFESYSADAVVLAQGASNVAIQRKDVVRVTITESRNRWRNMAIGMGVGAAAGALIGTLATSTGDMVRAQSIGFLTGVGFAAGAVVGATIPSHPTVYRAPQP
jgi:hypothetical protein